MQTNYIYSTNRVTAVATTLLQTADIERLLQTTSSMELVDVLKETYLGAYLDTVTAEQVTSALETAVMDAKRTIETISPVKDLFQLLWIQHDIHNLRTFAKATRHEVSYSDLTGLLSERGHYSSTVLHSYLERNELNRLQTGWQEVYDQAVRHVADGEIDKVDALFDQLYFNTIIRLATWHRDVFLTVYVRALIDCYNLKAKLRVLRYPALTATTAHVSGGTFAASELETKDQVKQAAAVLGTVDWEVALTQYEETGNTTVFDVCVDAYLFQLAKQASYDAFSSASIVRYYRLAEANVSNVRAIINGKNSRMDETIIRANLRLVYDN